MLPVSPVVIPTVIDRTQLTLPPPDENVLQIDNVYGVGRLDSEMVVIKHVGDGDLIMTGWKMVDEHNHQYIFPHLTLSKGMVNINTRAGIDTVKDLHWGLTRALWQSGEHVRIYDPLGNLRADYLIP
jgi:hypothetical protein